MKKHGYFTDHEESYAASATELAKEYSAPVPMSDEEKAALEETERNSFFSVFGEHLQAKKAKETEMMNNLQIQLMDMTENGTSNEDMYEFIKSKGVENPELFKQRILSQFEIERIKSRKGEDAYGGFGTKENQNKAFEKYMNRIGVDILDKKLWMKISKMLLKY